jgi:hypothetical protein
VPELPSTDDITAGTNMDATKLPLTKWFQAFYLVEDA